MVSRRGPLDQLVADVDAYPLRRGNVETDRKDEVVAHVRDRVRATYDDVSELDGVRVGTDDGWFLVRASGTEPLVRITAEARSEGRADELFENARELIEDCLRSRRVQ
jgi:phosphoglucosamine mutase